jgi:hypothetical protein
LSLEDRDKQVQKLLQNKINQRSISTQTDLIPDPPTTPNSFYTAFESSSEAFGLIPIQPNTLSKQRQTSMRSSWQTVVANEDHLNSVVHSLQNFKINNDYTTNDDIFESWLHQNANDHEQGRLRHPML